MNFLTKRRIAEMYLDMIKHFQDLILDSLLAEEVYYRQL